MSSKNIVGGQRSGQSATSRKSHLNRAFNRVRIISDNETLANFQRAKGRLRLANEKLRSTGKRARLAQDKYSASGPIEFFSA
jgi:hypothetical protein